MKLSRKFQTYLFFLQKAFERKIAPKRKTKDFQFFVPIKNVAFVI